MTIGVPKEIKDHEARVGLVPSGVTALREAGHQVVVQSGAGKGSSLPDEDYSAAGANILPTAAEVWQQADLVIKVKEPQPSEYGYLRPDLLLFTYLHLAPLPELTEKLLRLQGQCDRLRDDSRKGRLAAAVDADERSGRAHVGPGRRAVSGSAQRRTRHSAGRRSGCRSGQRR